VEARLSGPVMDAVLTKKARGGEGKKAREKGEGRDSRPSRGGEEREGGTWPRSQGGTGQSPAAAGRGLTRAHCFFHRLNRRPSLSSSPLHSWRSWGRNRPRRPRQPPPTPTRPHPATTTPARSKNSPARPPPLSPTPVTPVIPMGPTLRASAPLVPPRPPTASQPRPRQQQPQPPPPTRAWRCGWCLSRLTWRGCWRRCRRWRGGWEGLGGNGLSRLGRAQAADCGEGHLTAPSTLFPSAPQRRRWRS
jgi:hypothetical protein